MFKILKLNIFNFLLQENKLSELTRLNIKNIINHIMGLRAVIRAFESLQGGLPEIRITVPFRPFSYHLCTHPELPLETVEMIPS